MLYFFYISQSGGGRWRKSTPSVCSELKPEPNNNNSGRHGRHRRRYKTIMLHITFCLDLPTAINTESKIGRNATKKKKKRRNN